MDQDSEASNSWVEECSGIDSIKTLCSDSLNDSGISYRTKSSTQWFECFDFGNLKVNFKLDTGSEINVLPLKYMKQINQSVTIKPLKMVIETYGGNKLNPVGSVKLNCKYKNVMLLQYFIVVETDSAPILGLRGCRDFGLIKRVDQIMAEEKERFIKENLDVCTGLGTFPNTYEVRTRPNCEPNVKAAGSLPLLLHECLKAHLKQLEKLGIIQAVAQPKSWVSNLVVAENRNGELRFCLDPQDLNKAMIKENCLIPKMEEFTASLSNTSMTFFTVLDFKQGFWQIKLDVKSSHVCTFSTPFGCFKFNRLPFGVNICPEVFQMNVSNHFKGIPGTEIYINDLLVCGKTQQEHDRSLISVFERARNLKFRFNPGKLQYKGSSVKYVGQIFSADGMRPDPSIITAILNLERPKDKKNLQSFIGMINFLMNYTPNLSEACANLRELLKEDIELLWTQVHTQEFEKIKTLISKAPILQSYDPDKEIILQCDASQSGIGACLLQEAGPVSYASRSLSPAEKNYAQIEKEMLVIAFACRKFHYYIYGKRVKVQTNHEPLILLFKSDLSKVYVTRLQRMRMSLLKYSINVEFVAKKYLHIADLLSHNYDTTEAVVMEEDFNEVIHAINITENRKSLIQIASLCDPVLSKVMQNCKSGWPTDKSKVSNEIMFFYKNIQAIYLDDGMLFFEKRVIIPQSMRKEILSLLYQAHLGIQKTKDRAKQLVFWPNINYDIENMIECCMVCQKYKSKNCNEPIIFHNIPPFRFIKLHMDIMYYENKNYLVVGDYSYFSKWIEILELKTKTIIEIIIHLKSLFSTHGIPKEIVCVNKPFNSFQLIEFSKKYDFKTTFSSPYCPQSKEFAEKYVGKAKHILKKSTESRTDLCLALLEYRNTPISTLRASPAQILFSRQCRTLIATHDSNLQSQIIRDILERIKDSQKKIRSHYNLSSKERPSFQTGDNIMYPNAYNLWCPYKIVQLLFEPWSYIMEGSGGESYRKNKKFVNKLYMLDGNAPETHINQQSREQIPDSNIQDQMKSSSGIYNNENDG